MKEKVLIIVGQTATGKSDLAVFLAKKFNGEIISADSRQVYRGLDVGSGKITKKEMRGVPHHLLDVADPKKVFTVSQYKARALTALKDILSRKKLPIIVGGTGFYIDAVTGTASFPDVPPNEKLRKLLSKKTTEELFTLLKKKDPERARTIDSKNKIRLIRALEIVEAIGKVPLLGSSTSKSPYEFIFIGLKPEKDELHKRIEKRLKKRMSGMIKEAKALHQKGLSFKRMENLGLEYRYLARFLQGKLSKEEMSEELYCEIKKYAKRQNTWFKRNPEIKWFQLDQFKEIEEYAKMSLTKGL